MILFGLPKISGLVIQDAPDIFLVNLQGSWFDLDNFLSIQCFH